MKPLLKRPGFYVAAIIGALLLLVLGRGYMDTVAVQTTAIKRGPLELTVTATATGTIKPDTEIRIAAQRPGRVSELFVKEGSTVKAGDPLAALDPMETSLRLSMAGAALARSEAVLKEATSTLDSLGTEVLTGISRAEAALAEAEGVYKSYVELHEKGYISKIRLEGTKARYDIALADHKAALARKKQIKAAEQAISARKSAVAEAESAFSLASLNHSYSNITSPAAGVISSVPIKAGQTVLRGTPVATLISVDSLYIEAFIDESDVGRVTPGQTVRIAMDAYPERAFIGTLYMVSPVVLGKRHETRTFEVRTRMGDVDVAVKPGMSADIEIVVDRVPDALTVPAQAVLEQGGESFVYVVSGGRARLKKVTTGLSNWTDTRITGGVEEGDIVITNPDVPGLKDGKKINAADNRP